MNGVEILASEQVIAQYRFSTATIIVISFIMTVAIVGGVYLSIRNSDWQNLFFSLVCGIIGSLFAGAFIQEFTKAPLEYETQYKVIISDETLMSDFYNKYEIVEQEGKIFTVREIEVEE